MKEHLEKFFQRTALKRKIFFIFTDIVFIAVSICLAFLLRFEGSIPFQYFPIIQKFIILALLFCLPVFYFSRLYSFSWSYVSTQELVSLFGATTLGFLFSGIAIYISRDYHLFEGFPRSTLFISYFLTFLLCGGIRFSKRIYLQTFQGGSKMEKERTLIVGAGDAGEQILRSILTSKDSPFLPVGFIDDNPIKKGEIIHGIKIIGGIDDVPELIKDNLIEGMIIALPSFGSKAIKRAVEAGKKAGLQKIKIIPPVSEMINGEISARNLREVEIEDLLGREPVSLDQESIKNFIDNKVILVTGAAGSIGSELCRQISKFNPSLLLLLDQEETGIFNISGELKGKFPKIKFNHLIVDIRDKEKMERVINNYRPNIIFHAAAYKHVPLMEEHADEAVKNNIFGTKILGELAIKNGVEKVVFISTDKAVNPTSAMGATKRVGEMLCQVLNKKNHTKFISVRFGNVLDSRGSVIPIFREQIKKGGPVEVTHPEMKRYFMTNPEACLLVMQSGAMGEGGEVFVLDMGEPIKILDLAKEMIKLSGFEPDRDIPIIFTNPRPGEKLFEEIMTAEEGTIATKNQKIFMARLSDCDEVKLGRELEKLKIIVKTGNKGEIKTILKRIIPYYSSDGFV